MVAHQSPVQRRGQMREHRTARAARIWRCGVIGLAVGAVTLTACSSGGGADPGNAGGATSTTPPKPVMSISITPAASKSVNPSDHVEVHAKQGKLTKVTVTNAERGSTASGEFSDDKTQWESNEVLAFGATYNVVAKGTGTDGKPVTKKTTVSTIDPAKTSYTNTIPPHGDSYTIGIGQPIVVRFNDPVTNKAEVEKHLDVTSDPDQDGAWYWISDTEVHYRPKEFWQPGTKVTLDAKMYGVKLADGVYDKQDRHETYTVHDAWKAVADGNTHQMVIYHNGSAVKTMNISMGKDKTPTHEGIHVVSSKSEKVEMNSCSFGVCPPDPDAYDVTEYWGVRISNDGEFVHENPASVGSQGNTNVSHGCINLNEADAKWFFHHFNHGDVVIVKNSGGKKLPIYDLYGDWSVPWSQWKAGNADS